MTDELRVDPGDWEDALADLDGPQLIVGGPGTGKTEFLVRRAIRILQERPDGGLLMLSFSRRSVADLAGRLRTAYPEAIRAVATATYHSLAMRLMEVHAERRGWNEPPRVLSAPEQTALVARMLAEERPEAWSPAFRGILKSRTFAEELTDLLLRCREQLIGPDDLRAMDRPEWRGVPAFIDRYDATLRASGRIDYGTLLTEAVALLTMPEVRTAVTRQYGHILVDEYQDTTRAQVTLLGSLAADHGNIAVAGDPYQSIYSFRGADLRNVERFIDEFSAPDRRPRRYVLTTSFRVPEPILVAAERVAAHELPGASGPVVPTDGVASVETYRFEQQTEEAEWVAAEIQRTHLELGLPFSSMAVFVRSKRRFLPELSRALERRDIPHERPDSRLADQPAVRFVLDCVIAATDRDPAERDRAIRRILLGPLFRLPLGTLHDLLRDKAARQRSWPDAIRRAVPGAEALADLIEDPTWATELPAHGAFWKLWTDLPQIAEVVADPEGAESRAAWSSLAQVLARWNDRDREATLVRYLELTEDEAFEANPLLSYRRTGADHLVVTTLHQSKGLHFDVVFICDAVEGVFPDLRPRDSLLGARHLTEHLPADTAEYLAFRLQEERRLAYTAMTRAVRRVVWTATSTGYDEGRGIPSRFLALVAGTATVADAASPPPRRSRPVTITEFDGYLRRLVADPATPPARRLAALDVLADGIRLGLGDPRSISGVLPRRGDTGILPAVVTLSPSQGELYETCPRRYALERRLGIGRSESLYAEFGTLVHGVLEAVEAAALARGEPHGTLAEAVTELDARFDPGRFGGEPFASAWLARGRTALENLYGRWPSTGAVVDVERRLERSHRGVRWIGKADRIERRDEGLVVVDYKTTKSPLPRADAERSLQLGYYLLAAREDAELRDLGEPIGAELWYPLKMLEGGPAVRLFDAAQLEEITERMTAVTDGILAEDWVPTPGPHCLHCAVALVCPARPEGREAFAS